MSRRFLPACFLPVGLVLATQSIMAAESETIDLDVVMDHTQSAVYDPLFKEFEALHPDVKFKLQVVPAGTTDVIAKIAAQFATGDPPDIILQFGAPDAAQNGEILDLWPLINTDPAFKAQFPPTILDEALKASEIPGKMFSFPVSLTVNGGMVYRKSLLTAAGFPLPHDGWTKDEFLTDAEKLTLRDPDGNYKRMGYNPTKNGWDAWLTESMQQPEYNPATMEWFPNEQAAEEAFQWATDLLSTHAVGAAKGWAWFTRGQAAFLNGTPELIGRDPSFDPHDIGYIHFPLWDSSLKPIIPWGTTGISLGNTNDPRRIKAAWEFVKFRTSKAAQLQVVSLDPSQLPTNRSAMQGLSAALPANMPGREALVYSLGFVTSSPAASPRPPLFWDSRINEPYIALSQKMFDVQIPPLEFIRQMKQIARNVYMADGLLKPKS